MTGSVIATWYSLPPPLDKIIEARIAQLGRVAGAPAIVALGVRDAWVVVWRDRTVQWDLKRKYEELEVLFAGNVVKRVEVCE